MDLVLARDFTEAYDYDAMIDIVGVSRAVNVSLSHYARSVALQNARCVNGST